VVQGVFIVFELEHCLCTQHKQSVAGACGQVACRHTCATPKTHLASEKQELFELLLLSRSWLPISNSSSERKPLPSIKPRAAREPPALASLVVALLYQCATAVSSSVPWEGWSLG
jgi:hypothetical protein